MTSDSDRKAAKEWAEMFWDESELDESEKSEQSTLNLAISSGECGFVCGVKHERNKWQSKMKDLPSDIQQLVTEHFWELLA